MDGGLDFNEIMRIQNLMAASIADESEVNNKLKIIDIITQLTGKKKYVQVEEVIIEANYQSISENTTMHFLDELNSDNVILMVDGRVKMNY